MFVNLGIDLGGSFIKFGIVNSDFKILAKKSIPTNAQRSFSEIAQDIANTCHQLLQDNHIHLDQVRALGIGVPSIINPHNQHIVFANNLNWTDIDLLSELRKHINLPMFIADDADCAALGEAVAGAGRGIKNSLMITLGTGVGGGFIIHGKIYTGGDGFGCEPGHTILQMNGEACTCGRKGCLEAYTSVTALIRDAKRILKTHPESLILKLAKQDIDRIDGQIIFDAADLKDTAAMKVIDQYLSYLAEGIASLHNALRPEVIIIGGGISARKEKLIEPLKIKLKELVFAADILGIPHVVVAELGNDAGILGAAFLNQDDKT
jgi:glucokinase